MAADLRKYIDAACQARLNAYAPYSKYSVGAIVVTADGQIFAGANVENAAYPAGICAERVALFNAVASGARAFTVLAVVTADGQSPCGACRQAIAEFGDDIRIIAADPSGQIHMDTTIAELLPHLFKMKTAP
jgi:cytidine deaminase